MKVLITLLSPMILQAEPSDPGTPRYPREAAICGFRANTRKTLKTLSPKILTLKP